MLVTSKELFEKARAEHYAIPAPNFIDLESLRWHVEVAEELHMPVILALAEAHMGENITLEDVKYCRKCMMISDEEECSICRDTHRDHDTICVVENVRDVMSIEATGQYHGVYHVLGGKISPIDGIGPSDLKIAELKARVQAAAEGAQSPDTVEVILALSGDVEGETTSFYIYRQIAPYGVKVSSLARGLGFGDDLEYADQLTLGRSIVNRQVFRP